jgi:hypothetical protein
VINGAPFSDATLQEAMESFDCDDQGRMTLAGFEEMYHLQTTSEPEATVKDLSVLGYAVRGGKIIGAAGAATD